LRRGLSAWWASVGLKSAAIATGISVGAALLAGPLFKKWDAVEEVPVIVTGIILSLGVALVAAVWSVMRAPYDVAARLAERAERQRRSKKEARSERAAESAERAAVAAASSLGEPEHFAELKQWIHFYLAAHMESTARTLEGAPTNRVAIVQQLEQDKKAYRDALQAAFLTGSRHVHNFWHAVERHSANSEDKSPRYFPQSPGVSAAWWQWHVHAIELELIVDTMRPEDVKAGYRATPFNRRGCPG
jgi:hypothetical protein